MSNNKKNLLISGLGPDKLLRINESATGSNKSKKYVFTGCFTQCSSKKPGGIIVKNRNNRIYFDDEVLRHLGYLRDQIKENGFLAGELDHPDRFEVKLSECSHKITDLWYDPNTQKVMGTLELLDTPKGMIARKLVDEGLNLAVSSRSAGSVRSDASVELDMIYTWDIVFTPGFQEAHLERIMESLTNPAAKKYLNETLSTSEENESDIIEVKKTAVINEKIQNAINTPVDMSKLCTPICEAEEEKKDEEIGLPEANLNPLEEDNDDTEKDDTEKSEDKSENKKSDDKEEKHLTDEDKKKRRESIVSIEPKGVEDKESASGENPEENREKIVNIEGVVDDKDEDKEDKSEETEKSDDTENKESKDENKDSIEECGDEVSEDDDDPTAMKTKDAKTSKKILNDCDNTCEDIQKQTAEDMDNVKKLLDKAKKRKEVKEAIYRAYPFAVSLSEENFGKFAALEIKDKNKVQKYIIEHGIFSIRDINEQWNTPLLEERRQLKNWLRLASDEDRRLFAQAPIEVQDAIEESAKYMLIQNKRDADIFWEKTGLRQQQAAKIINESLKEKFQIQSKEEAENVELTNQQASELGYSMNYFKILEEIY